MKILLTALITLVSLSLSAQDVEFAYDNAGNRITRRIINIPVPLPPESNREEEGDNDDTTSMAETGLNKDTSVQQMVGLEKLAIIDSLDGTIYKLYPNPVTTSLTIDLGLNFTTNNNNQQIKIIDAQGKLVKEISVVKQKTIIDLSAVAAGSYNVMLTENGKMKKSWKVIKE